MITRILICFICSITMIPASGMTKTKSFYSGIIRVPSGKAPSDCYTIIRNEKEIEPKYQDEHVFNGDIIHPKNNISVTLIYRHSECSEIEVKDKITVNCDFRSCKKPGWLKDMLIKLLKKKRVIRQPLKLVQGVTARNLTNEKYHCIPTQPFDLSPLPSKNARILYGQDILFRRDNIFLGDAKACSQATLVITQLEDSSDPKEYEFVIGKMMMLDGSEFKAGKTYTWTIKQNNKTISETNHFTILDIKSSENINAQLLDIEKTYLNNCPGLKQALFLRLLSQSSPSLDLTSDSLRLMWNNRQCIDQSRAWDELLTYIE